MWSESILKNMIFSTWHLDKIRTYKKITSPLQYSTWISHTNLYATLELFFNIFLEPKISSKWIKQRKWYDNRVYILLLFSFLDFKTICKYIIVFHQNSTQIWRRVTHGTFFFKSLDNVMHVNLYENNFAQNPEKILLFGTLYVYRYIMEKFRYKKSIIFCTTLFFFNKINIHTFMVGVKYVWNLTPVDRIK